jgi:hypothetical protein
VFSNNFYHSLTRKYITVFGTLFNSITVIRKDEDGFEDQRFTVPITFSHKQKYLQMLESDPDLFRSTQIVVPALSYQIDSITYDQSRKLNSLQKNCKVLPSLQGKKTQFVPVPYNIAISLFLYSKNLDDHLQIQEQILPYFTPSFTVGVNILPEMSKQEDLAIVLNGVTMQDQFDGIIIENRYLISTFSFTLKANYYGPISETGVIKSTQIDLYATSGDGEVTQDQIETTPRNIRIKASVNPNSAGPNDPHTIVETVQEFKDNKKYNPVTGQDEEIV